MVFALNDSQAAIILKNFKAQEKEILKTELARIETLKKAEKADCSKMDHSKMDMKDPVAIAMMKKCMKQSEAAKKSMKDMDHSKMEDMDHSKMKDMDHSKMKDMDHSKMKDMDHSKMKKAEHKANEKDDNNEHNH